MQLHIQKRKVIREEGTNNDKISAQQEQNKGRKLDPNQNSVVKQSSRVQTKLMWYYITDKYAETSNSYTRCKQND
jgi:hypothetical protein